MRTTDIVVVGAGVAGLATAWALAERGTTRVLVLEREPAIARASSGLNAGILRSASDPTATRRLALETGALLRDLPPSLEAVATGPLLDPRGLVVVEGRADLPVPRWVAALQAAGVAAPLELAELERRVPVYRPEGARAWLLAGEGRIDIHGLAQALADAAVAAGARIRTSASVARVLVDGVGAVHGVQLETGEVIDCGRVVLAPGGWASELARSCGGHFPGRTTRRHLFVTAPHPGVDAAWPIVWDDAAGFYFRPEAGGLMVCPCDQDDTEPAACVQDPLAVRAMQRRLALSLPTLPGLKIARGWCGMRTVTEDDQPVIGPDRNVPGLFWVAALGGHGMSVSLAVGRLAAMLLTEGAHSSELALAVAPENRERDYAPLRDWQPL